MSLRGEQATDNKSVDNSLPAIWSFLEISVATTVASLPAIRHLLSRWLPKIFDLTTAPSTNPKYPASSYLQSSGSNPPKLKIGPTYDKRVIFTPDDDLLAPTPQFENFEQREDQISSAKDRKDTKIWVNPKFDNQGNVIDFQEHRMDIDIERQGSAPSSRTSVWALEGPRESDEMNGSDEGNIALQEIGVALGVPGLDHPRRIMERTDPRLQKELPLLPKDQEDGSDDGRGLPRKSGDNAR